jgi:Tfp pilus assembly protein PilF
LAHDCFSPACLEPFCQSQPSRITEKYRTRCATRRTLGIREAPGVAPLYTHLAMNYVGLGEIANARAALDEATRIAPGQVERSLARFMYRKQEHQRRGTTFLRIAAGLADPTAADALR